MKDIKINEGIKAKEVRLIAEDGSQLGVMPIKEAIATAQERGYDLVEVSPNSNPPVCKVMDFGKYKYQMSKKHTTKRSADIKEIKIRPQITDHDLQLKVKSIRRFLDEGDKAKVTMYFRGREIIRPEYGMKVFDRIIELMTGKYNVEQPAKLEGNHITMVIVPSSK